CNERCTYCVVPGVRGTEQSREPEAIRQEMQRLAAAGYKEVTLLGQNIDAYGRDLGGSAEDGSGRRKWTLTDLLRYVHDVEGIERIRFATSHIRFRFMESVLVKGRYCVQNAVEVRFDQVNTAAYSPRPNTPAADWPNQVAELVKIDRLQRINEMVLTHCLERNQRYLGRIEPLLVEGVNARAGREGEVMGRTDTNRLTFFKGGPELIGQIVPVRITDVRAVSLTGELVSAAAAVNAAAVA
ncbi:unnamed protein product, partial [Closterium sp. NIES-54]